MFNMMTSGQEAEGVFVHECVAVINRCVTESSSFTG